MCQVPSDVSELSLGYERKQGDIYTYLFIYVSELWLTWSRFETLAVQDNSSVDALSTCLAARQIDVELMSVWMTKYQLAIFVLFIICCIPLQIVTFHKWQ